MTECNYIRKWKTSIALSVALCTAPVGEVSAYLAEAPAVGSPSDTQSSNEAPNTLERRETREDVIASAKDPRATVDVSSSGLHIKSSDNRFALSFYPFVQIGYRQIESDLEDSGTSGFTLDNFSPTLVGTYADDPIV